MRQIITLNALTDLIWYSAQLLNARVTNDTLPALMENTAFGGVLFVMDMPNAKMNQGNLSLVFLLGGVKKLNTHYLVPF